MLYIRCADIYPQAKEAFQCDINWIRSVLKEEYLKGKNDFRIYSLGKSKKESEYKKWVLANALFLNPLNDVFYDTAIAYDVLQLPDMVIGKFKAPVFHGFYNQLKQEYITSRYLYYQYLKEIPEGKIHFSDRDRNLINTLDYPQYGYRYELLKDAFKSLYSIFDKIGYFINEYFELGIEQDKVYFRTVWYKDKAINPKIETLNNNPLRGLYYLSKDFYSKDTEYLEVADPDAQNMCEIRNNIEHKYFKIHWIKPVTSDDVNRFDNLAFSITEIELGKRVYRLLRCTREALIYLSLAIHENERKDEEPDKLVIPIPLIDYD
jgi:hypothetical protein